MSNTSYTHRVATKGVATQEDITISNLKEAAMAHRVETIMGQDQLHLPIKMKIKIKMYKSIDILIKLY